MDRAYLGFKQQILPSSPLDRDLEAPLPLPYFDGREQSPTLALAPILTGIEHVMGHLPEPFDWPEALWDLTPATINPLGDKPHASD